HEAAQHSTPTGGARVAPVDELRRGAGPHAPDHRPAVLGHPHIGHVRPRRGGALPARWPPALVVDPPRHGRKVWTRTAMAVMRNAAQAVQQPKLRVQQHDSAQLNGLGQWWNSRAPTSPPNGSCCWATCCAAAPGVAVTWALPALCCTPLPGLCCTLTTSAADAIGASAIAAAEAVMASGARWRSFMCVPSLVEVTSRDTVAGYSRQLVTASPQCAARVCADDWPAGHCGIPNQTRNPVNIRACSATFAADVIHWGTTEQVSIREHL